MVDGLPNIRNKLQQAKHINNTHHTLVYTRLIHGYSRKLTSLSKCKSSYQQISTVIYDWYLVKNSF